LLVVFDEVVELSPDSEPRDDMVPDGDCEVVRVEDTETKLVFVPPADGLDDRDRLGVFDPEIDDVELSVGTAVLLWVPVAVVVREIVDVREMDADEDEDRLAVKVREAEGVEDELLDNVAERLLLAEGLGDRVEDADLLGSAECDDERDPVVVLVVDTVIVPVFVKKLDVEADRD
jgi:hypothetical protein